MARGADADIDCPLFTEVQAWLVEDLRVPPAKALIAARDFMRLRWMPKVEQISETLRERARSKRRDVVRSQRGRE
jgi:hypothetical protein